MSSAAGGKIAPVIAWAYVVAATLGEMAIANNYIHVSGIYNTAAIGGLAATQVLALSTVFLRLKYEPKSIVGVAGASIFFAVLAVVLFIASLGH